MTYHLVKRITDTAYLGQTLSLELPDAAFAIPPAVGDVVFWNNDWGGETVEYRYISRDSVELGLGRVGPKQAQDYVAAGWSLR